MILYHAGKEKVEFPEVRKMKYTKDFSWGFYCTNNYEQAVRWAGRGEGEPIINYYDYEPDEKLWNMEMQEKFIVSMARTLDMLKLFNRNLKQTILLITHDEKVALGAERIITIEDGRIISDEWRKVKSLSRNA